ncbi:MAG: hypothetical protein U1F43_12670 [Myxococcota bacterium]
MRVGRAAAGWGVAACLSGAGCFNAPTDTGATRFGACVRPTAPLDARVVFSGDYTCAPPSAPSTRIIASSTECATLRQSLEDCSEAATSDVDFASEYVVVLGFGADQTCGIDLDALVVRGGPYVELEVTDSSGGCAAACASGDAYVVAVALPIAAGLTPDLCRRIHGACD